MNEEEYKKLDTNTKIKWYIGIFEEELESDFRDSEEFDKAFQEFILRRFENITEIEEQYLKKEIGVEIGKL